MEIVNSRGEKVNLLEFMRPLVSKSEALALEKYIEKGKTRTYEQIHAGAISPSYFYPLGSNAGQAPSQHSKELYKLTRQLTHFRKHLLQINETFLLNSVNEVISLITSYREDIRDLPFDWSKQKFLREKYRGFKLKFPPGKSRLDLECMLPEIVDEESDVEDDNDYECNFVGCLKNPRSTTSSLISPEPLLYDGKVELAVSYLSCLESICKAIDELSEEKIKRMRDIFMGLTDTQVYIAVDEWQNLKRVCGLTQEGLRSRLEEDWSCHLQSMTNLGLTTLKLTKGLKQASSSKEKTKLLCKQASLSKGKTKLCEQASLPKGKTKLCEQQASLSKGNTKKLV